MYYNITPDHKKLVLLKIILGVCQVNPEQQMNVEKQDLYGSLNFKKKKHNNPILILHICHFNRATKSYGKIIFASPAKIGENTTNMQNWYFSS